MSESQRAPGCGCVCRPPQPILVPDSTPPLSPWISIWKIEAEPAAEFSIAATGRDAERCSAIEDNLILGVYKRLLGEQGKPVVPLAIRMANGIPLGMGCGSSAAGRLAAIALAVHFGQLGWSTERS